MSEQAQTLSQRVRGVADALLDRYNIVGDIVAVHIRSRKRQHARTLAVRHILIPNRSPHRRHVQVNRHRPGPADVVLGEVRHIVRLPVLVYFVVPPGGIPDQVERVGGRLGPFARIVYVHPQRIRHAHARQEHRVPALVDLADIRAARDHDGRVRLAQPPPDRRPVRRIR